MIKMEDREYLIAFIRRQVNAAPEELLLSRLGELMGADERCMQIRQSSGGSFIELINSLAPQVQLLRNGNLSHYILMEEGVKGHFEVRTRSGYPQVLDPEDETSKAEVQKMHTIAFMGWWNNTYKILRRMTGYEGNNYEIWRAIIARQFVAAWNRGEFLSGDYQDENGLRRIHAFSTGLRTINGQTIYCILEPNGYSNVAQALAFAEYCVSGDRESRYGEMLRDVLGVAVEEPQVTGRRIYYANKLMDLRDQYAAVRDALERIAKGEFVTDDEHIRSIEYLDDLRKTLQSAKTYELISDGLLERCTIEDLPEKIASVSNFTYMKQYEERIYAVLDAVESFLRNNLGVNTGAGDHAVTRFRSFLKTAGADILNGGEPELHMQQYRAYTQMFDRMVGVLCRADGSQQQQVCQDFGMMPFLVGAIMGQLQDGTTAAAMQEAKEALEAFDRSLQEEPETEECFEEAESGASVVTPIKPEEEEDPATLMLPQEEEQEEPDAGVLPLFGFEDEDDDDIGELPGFCVRRNEAPKPVPEAEAEEAPQEEEAEEAEEGDAAEQESEALPEEEDQEAEKAALPRREKKPRREEEPAVPVVQLDAQYEARCLNGEINAMESLLRFGQWDWRKSAQTPQEDAAQAARMLLYSPQERTYERLILCLHQALSQGSWMLAQDLCAALERGPWRRVYQTMISVLRRMSTHDAHEQDSMDLFNTDLMMLDELTALVDTQDDAQKKLACMIMLAHLPFLMTRYFQKDCVYSMIEHYKQLEGAASRSMMNAIDNLNKVIHSNAQDAAYQRHEDVSARLKSANLKRNDEAQRERLMRRGLELKTQFERNSVNFSNARTVIRNFGSEDSERTKALLDSLISGRVVEGAVAFRSEADMLEYANSQQEKYLPLYSDITGAARSKLLSYMNDLNDAFLELCSLEADADGLSEQEREWYLLVGSRIDQYRAEFRRCLSSQDLPAQVEAYLANLCDGTIMAGEESILQMENLNAEVWPVMDEDRLIAALSVMAGEEWRSAQISQALVGGESDQDTRRSGARMAQTLLEECRCLMAQVFQLRRNSSIDAQLYEEFSVTLSCCCGWLQRVQSQLGDRSADGSLLLVRSEMDMRYVDRHVARIYEEIAHVVKQSIGSYDTDGEIAAQIDEAIARRDIGHIFERFSDTVTSISKLVPGESYADDFFSRGIIDRIGAAILNEKWRNGIVWPISDMHTWAEDEDIRKVGIADQMIRRYLDPQHEQSTLDEERLRGLFEFMGFGAPEVHADENGAELSFDVPDRSVCPMPALGIGITMRDEKGRWRCRYRVSIVKDRDALFGLINQETGMLGGMLQILICPFCVSFEDRRDLLRRARESRVSRNFFVVDHTFLRYQMCVRGVDRLKAFYACMSSLMRLDPYTTQTQTQWEGTFFGREEEISAVTRQINGVNVLYGGRRLGKTSILREAQFRWIRSAPKNLAFYINLQLLNSDLLWYEVAREMRGSIPELAAYDHQAGTPEGVDADAAQIMRAITDYLAQDSERRILLLLDESDDLVFKSSVKIVSLKSQTTRLSELNSLMESANSRFKVVLAGLERVTRFSRNMGAYFMIEDNSIRYQRYAESLCIRPMLNDDMQNAYELVDVPFRMMGYRLEHESILYILRVSCFRPNLIQNYCHTLLQAVRKRKEIGFEEDSLYLKVPHALVSGIYENMENQEYRKEQKLQSIRIPLNVGSTAVYGVAAYAVALLCSRHAPLGMITGFRSRTVLDEILRCNIHFSSGKAGACDYIDTVLDELVSMGVLRSFREAGETRYALFSHYMVEMLGSSESIEDSLNTALETYMANSNTADEDVIRREMFLDRRMGLGGNELDFYPMTVQQMQQMGAALKEFGYIAVVGSDMLMLNQLAGMLGELRIWGEEQTVHEISAPENGMLISALSELEETAEIEKKTHVVVVSDCSREFMELLRCRESRRVKVIVAYTPQMLWEMGDWLDELESQQVIRLARVSRSFLLTWFGRLNFIEKNRFGEDAGHMRRAAERVAQRTGEWPAMLLRFADTLRQAPEASVDELLDACLHNAGEIASMMGMEKVEPWIVEALLAAEEGDSLEEYMIFAPEDTQETRELLKRTVLYLNALGIGELIGENSAQLEEICFRLDAFTRGVIAGNGGDQP